MWDSACAAAAIVDICSGLIHDETPFVNEVRELFDIASTTHELLNVFPSSEPLLEPEFRSTLKRVLNWTDEDIDEVAGKVRAESACKAKALTESEG
jgi:hypothetical protein